MRKALFFLALLFVFMLGSTLPAYASPPVTASGAFTATEVTETSATFAVTGDFEGIVVQYFRPGRADEFTFTGTLNGVEGSFSGILLEAVKKPIGYMTLHDAEGGFENMHAQGTFTVSPDGVTGTYSINYHFDP